MKTIAEVWLSYLNRVIPMQAPHIQRVECKRAFYAGAQAFLSLQLSNLENGVEATEADFKMMDNLAAELQTFNKDVKEGRE